ncbi:hypothetical protein RJT34_25306 [Clitoria ternatea]|uniref:Uncharacterized protein n=1 Tax=Clitoria ternatea TaxID=43366 RepID=A0AAN9FPN2_CLITE
MERCCCGLLALYLGAAVALDISWWVLLRELVLQLENATVAVDALSVCMTINGWEMMIPLAFFAGTGPGERKTKRIWLPNDKGNLTWWGFLGENCVDGNYSTINHLLNASPTLFCVEPVEGPMLSGGKPGEL